ncbi:MAG: chemotaxis protein CheD [Myxococcales bacterium FL481]|nr:MAG: chemotaxis protein CheD [Myxococcales bacterium FL481]
MADPVNLDRELVVGIGAMEVSDDVTVTLSTYALGSCLGIVIYDPVARVGGILHAMLPTGELNPTRAESTPAVFVDRGLPALFRAAYALGAIKSRTVVRIVGAASRYDGRETTIGRKNVAMAKKLLWRNSVRIVRSIVGGTDSRTLYLSVETGELRVQAVDKQFDTEDFVMTLDQHADGTGT